MVRDISAAAAALGRKGGAVKGPSKARGDSEHYRALVAKRKDRRISDAKANLAAAEHELATWILKDGYGIPIHCVDAVRAARAEVAALEAESEPPKEK